MGDYQTRLLQLVFEDAAGTIIAQQDSPLDSATLNAPAVAIGHTLQANLEDGTEVFGTVKAVHHWIDTGSGNVRHTLHVTCTGSSIRTTS